MRALVVAAALLGLLLVAAGAAGAHTVPIDAGARWQSAMLYGFVHTLAAAACATLPFRSWLRIAAGWSFILAVILFSGVQIGKIMLAGVSGRANAVGRAWHARADGRGRLHSRVVADGIVGGDRRDPPPGMIRRD